MKQIPKRKKYGCILIVLCIILIGVFVIWSNNSIQISEYTYISDQIPSGFDGYTIVQISDLHNHVFVYHDSSLLKKIKSLSPNCIVLTGDILDNSTHSNQKDALLFTEQVTQIAKTYFVTGNHEDTMKKERRKAFIQEMKADGVVYLSNESVHLRVENGDTMLLIGIADNSLQSSKLENIMSEQDENDVQILLAHEPQFLNDYAETGVDIVFSGHAHGGQFRIPFTHQGLFAPDQGIFPEYTEGAVIKENTTMYISRGLGNSAFPFRLFNRPEIVCVTLSSQ